MGIRLALFLSIIGFSILISFVRPFWGLLVYSWLAFMRPQTLAWAETGWRFSYYIAIAMLLGCIFNFRREKMFIKTRENYLMIILWIMWFISFIFALNIDVAKPRMIEFTKIILITIILTGLVNSQKRFKYICWVIALSFGFLGIKGAIRGLFFGWHLSGPAYSMIADNNDFALGLNMVLPFFIYLAMNERKKWKKLFFYLQFPLLILAIIYTYSRGGFIGLCAVILVLALKSRRKVLGFTALALGAILFLNLAPLEYKERIETMKTYEEDASAVGRVYAWRAALSMAKDRPLTGVGPGKDSFLFAFPMYTYYPISPRVAHNSYLELLADSGFIALGIFLFLLYSSIKKLGGLRKSFPLNEANTWLHNYSNMLEVGFVGYMVSGFFLSRADFELLYYFIGMTVALDYIVRRESKYVKKKPSN